MNPETYEEWLAEQVKIDAFTNAQMEQAEAIKSLTQAGLLPHQHQKISAIASTLGTHSSTFVHNPTPPIQGTVKSPVPTLDDLTANTLSGASIKGTSIQGILHDELTWVSPQWWEAESERQKKVWNTDPNWKRQYYTGGLPPTGDTGDTEELMIETVGLRKLEAARRREDKARKKQNRLDFARRIFRRARIECKELRRAWVEKERTYSRDSSFGSF